MKDQETQLKKQAVLALLQKTDYRPMTAEEIAAALGEADWERFLALLREMEKARLLVVTKKGRYAPATAIGLYRGIFHGKQAGYGFLGNREDDKGDIFIKAAFTHGAMDGDTVLVRMAPEIKKRDRRYHYRPPVLTANKRREGEVIEILDRANKELVGTAYSEGGVMFLLPANQHIGQEIVIPKGKNSGAKSGDAVVADIVTWPQGHHPALAAVKQVLGRQEEAGIDMRILVQQYGLSQQFSKGALKQSRAWAERGILPEDYAKRQDLRDWEIVTIDGADAKDLDDGVSIEKRQAGWRLGVHIADVGHYVPVGSPLDRDAMERGTSVYLPGLVLPMLPPELSNGLCSLNAGEDRLALTCVMDVSASGKIEKYHIFESVIRVKKRMSYDKVNAFYQGDGEYGSFADLLLNMRELMAARVRFRHRRGSIDFNFPEAKVILDEETGKVLDIRRREQGLGEKIIEEAMICANEAVATEYYRRGIPFIYRVHLGPSGEKLEALNTVLGPLGQALPIREIEPKEMQKVLEHLADSPLAPLVQIAALRSMPHAYYDTEAKGHFGLASQYYSHFTSPIRRYADLSIHRVIKKWSKGKPAPKEEEAAGLKSLLDQAAQAASLTERAAEEAEREAIDIKSCLYMEDHLGETFAGIISGGNNYGIYVELDNTIEGMIRVDDLPPDDYTFSATTLTMQGRKKSHRFALGDRINITVSRVDVATRQIDFVLSKEEDR